MRIGLRELARRVGKSPSFIVAIELDDGPPKVAEATLRDIAAELKLNGDELVTIAGKTPEDVAPRSALEVALYRLVGEMSEGDQKVLYRTLTSGEWEE
jgi:hypothetical protein